MAFNSQKTTNETVSGGHSREGGRGSMWGISAFRPYLQVYTGHHVTSGNPWEMGRMSWGEDYNKIEVLFSDCFMHQSFVKYSVSAMEELTMSYIPSDPLGCLTLSLALVLCWIIIELAQNLWLTCHAVDGHSVHRLGLWSSRSSPSSVISLTVYSGKITVSLACGYWKQGTGSHIFFVISFTPLKLTCPRDEKHCVD